MLPCESCVNCGIALQKLCKLWSLITERVGVVGFVAIGLMALDLRPWRLGLAPSNRADRRGPVAQGCSRLGTDA
jgi:hypothetical protein